MAWLGTPGTPWTTSKKYITETKYTGYWFEGQFYITGQVSRTRTVTAQRYGSLTEAAAETLAATLAVTANVVDAHTERTSDAGSYAVLVTYDVVGAWA